MDKHNFDSLETLQKLESTLLGYKIHLESNGRSIDAKRVEETLKLLAFDISIKLVEKKLGS